MQFFNKLLVFMFGGISNPVFNFVQILLDGIIRRAVGRIHGSKMSGVILVLVLVRSKMQIFQTHGYL